MKDEILERMKDYLQKNVEPDAILSDVQNKKMIDMETMQNNPELFRQFMEDIKSWSDESKRGLVCGIFGCTNPPNFVCKHCKSSYCERCKEFHIHAPLGDGLIEAEAFDK